MSAYSVVLYLHLLSVLIGIGAAAVLIVSLTRLRAADTLESAAPWGLLAGAAAKGFPVAILGLFLTGAYMTSDVWSWDTGWIDVGIAALVVLGAQGALVSAPSGKRVEHALQENGPGPLSMQARRIARHPGLLAGEGSAVGLVLGIIWNMTTKPGLAGAIAAALIGYAVGGLVGLRASRTAEAEAEPVRAAG